MNVEGRWQAFEGALALPGHARPAWKVLRVMGKAFDLDGFDQLASSDVVAEARAAIGDVAPTGPSTEGPISSVAEREPDAIWRIGEVPIYAVDPLVRRSGPLQATTDGRDRSLALGPALAASLGVEPGHSVRVCQGGAGAFLLQQGRGTGRKRRATSGRTRQRRLRHRGSGCARPVCRRPLSRHVPRLAVSERRRASTCAISVARRGHRRPLGHTMKALQLRVCCRRPSPPLRNRGG